MEKPLKLKVKQFKRDRNCSNCNRSTEVLYLTESGNLQCATCILEGLIHAGKVIIEVK